MAFHKHNIAKETSQPFSGGKGPGLNFRKGISLIQFFKLFPDDEASMRWFIHTRWPEGIACPRCGSVNVNDKASHPTMPFRCRDCDKQFSPKTGTVMECSNLGYQVWLLAIYLLATNLKGVSSMKMHRDLDVTQTTAWFIGHRIRKAWEEEKPETLTGTVEVDETYIGGVEKNKHAKKKLHENWRDGKIPVIGLKGREERKVSAIVPDDTSEETLQGFISRRVKDGSTVYTDGLHEYRGMEYAHEWVNHNRGEYVRGDCSTNGIESFWAGIKRAYKGTYHQLSRKHLPLYIAEFVARYNTRPEDTIDQMKGVVEGMENKRLCYRELVA